MAPARRATGSDRDHTSKHAIPSKPDRRARAHGDGTRSLAPGGIAAGAAFIAALTTLAYLPSLGGGFILDDNILLTDNAVIRARDGLYRIWFTTEAIDYWPIFNTALWLQWRAWGMQPAGYHVVNLLLHLAGVFSIWAILHRLSMPGAFLAALLFAVHPVNVESVAWISQCKSVLALLFFFVSILLYVRAEGLPRSRATPAAPDRRYWLSLAAFVAAMLSKGSVAILPAVLLGIVAWFRPLTRRDLIRSAPFFAVGAALVLVNMWFQTHGAHIEVRHATPVERLLGAGAGVWFYVSKAIAPLNLAFIYPQWHIDADQLRWWAPLVAAVVTTAVLWRLRRGRARPLWFAWAYFCAALVPVLGLTDVAFMEHSLVADHYQHVALVGAVTLAAAAWGKWQRAARGWIRLSSYGLAAAAVGVLALLTWRQSGLYVEAMTLYEATLEKNPDSWLTHNNLGGVLFESGRVADAIGHFEQALRLNPDYADAHNNLGVALRSAERESEATDHFEAAVRLRPSYPQAHYNLAKSLARAGRQRDALEHLETAIALKPDYAEAHNDIGVVLARAGQLQEAIAQFRRALEIQPDFADAQFNLDLAFKMAQQAGRPSE